MREAVGDDMVLMLDPFGVYTLEEARWVGRELEKLNFYWLEHPMIETRVEAYRRLTRDLDIAICSPEHVPGGVFSRAEWALQGAADMLRIDIYYGGITGCWKLINLCQAFGLQCEMHTGGWANAQLLAATPAATCEYYEWGLLRPGVDYPELLASPATTANPAPPNAEGNVPMPQGPGLGFEIDWDYVNAHRVKLVGPPGRRGRWCPRATAVLAASPVRRCYAARRYGRWRPPRTGSGRPSPPPDEDA